jgi:hypothetical protein
MRAEIDIGALRILHAFTVERYRKGWRYMKSQQQCLSPFRLRLNQRLFNPNRLP